VFTQEQVKPAVRIERRIIPRLYACVKFLLGWLNTTGRQEIPQAYATLVEENDGSPKLKSALEALETIQTALILIKGIFGSKELDTRLSLTLLSELLPQLEGDVVAALTLYEKVKALLPVGPEPKTVGELECDAKDIDLLSTKLTNIQRLNLEKVLRGNDVIANAIASPDRFRMLAENIQAAKRVCDRLLQNRQRKIIARRAFEIIQALQTNMPVWQHYMEQYSKQVDELNRLFENDASIQQLEPLLFDHFLEKLLVMSTDVKGLEAWTLYRRYTGQLESLGQSWFIAETKEMQEVQPAPLFAQSLWSAWLEAHYQNNPILYHFNRNEHHKLIEEFRRLEDDVLRVNALRILKSAAPSINQAKRYGRRQDAELVHQSQLQKRHKPIRRLVQTCGSQLQHYKACWMMSPLTLSSYIPFGSLEFDVVIFDEASQMRVEHSLGAIARAKQVLILGDEHQLPPTSFFEVISESTDEEEAADIDYESILHAAKAILPGADELLSYHYRSKFEELIAFSNHYIYDDRLITFPNPEKQHKAVVFEYVENGIYDSGATRRNVVEASRVIELCAAALEYPDRSIGVIAFSKAQEQAIRDAKLTYIKRNPQLESRLDEESDAPDPFFIKNLETVQGDERDIIVLSIGYGRDKQGNVYNRFGPINTQYGYRRLNVAVTRAKEKVICVSSLKAGDIRPSERARGAQLLQKYLEYAEQGIKVLQASLLVQNQLGIEPDSPFELEVENALKRRGYNIHRQVGASGYKIDLAVVNPSNNQEYLLGIECDGASYHSSYSARVNDRIRQEILERLGWKVYRIWSQHWISNREEIIEDIVRVISDNSIPDFRQPTAGANLLM
jgi:very-short-patch-repair endonuclease